MNVHIMFCDHKEKNWAIIQNHVSKQKPTRFLELCLQGDGGESVRV